MNRRDLMRGIIPSVAGLAAMVVGVKAAPSETQQVLIDLRASRNEWLFNEAVIKAVTDDYKSGGKVREAVNSSL